MFAALDFAPIWLTLKLAIYTTWILLIVALPLAWWLSFSRNPITRLVSIFVAMPLVLPPTVLGFYLLLFFGPQGWGGQFIQWLNLDSLPFTFRGLVVASVVYSMPFAVQPLQNAFVAIGKRPLEVAATLGASRFDCFASIVLPLSRPAIISATILTFTHTLGEFGVVLMIGGNIPGETRVLSMAIYDSFESQDYLQAHWLSGGMLIFVFLILIIVDMINPQKDRLKQ